MRKNLFSLLFIFICFNAAYTQTIFKNYIDGRVYVRFHKAALKGILKEDPENIPLAKLSALKDLFAKYGITKVCKPFYQASDDDNLSSVLKLEFTKMAAVDALIEDLKKCKDVEYAERVNLMKTDLTTPNDFSISSASLHLTQINAQGAWDYFNGNSNITVAIVDNAVMWTHADLVSNTYTNAVEAAGITGVDDDGNGYIDDLNGWDAADNNNNPLHPNTALNHGTHCAGIAGARTDNATGIASIGWNLKIIPVQCEPDASNNTLNVSSGYEGILYAVKAKAKIISCSWGNQVGSSQTEQYVIDYAWNRGCIIIASAGNSGNSTPNYPGAYNHVYCVGSVDASDVRSSFSNYGTWVDICAPGNNIYSTVPYATTPAYQPLSGTSMSTPMVAGLAGLMLSRSPGMTRSDVLNCISTTAANVYTLAGNSSYSGQLGAGRINALAAMICASSFSVIPPVANFSAIFPSTCPNTLISFADSSLYGPTSWSWVFQGGTPATSTSSNPSVMWATPGTYSVSLTVANANGTHTKTKLSYIIVAGPSALPFSEGFQSASFLPVNWTPNNIWNDNIYWERVTGIGGYGTSTACARFDNFNMNAPGEKDEMRTPKFDFTNVANAQLKFDVAYARYDAFFSDSLEVKVSTNCGTSWTSIYLKGGTTLATAADQGSQFSPTSAQWRTESISLPALAGQPNVMFSFLNRGHYGQPVYLDNINLSFPVPTLNVSTTPSICISPSYTFSNASLGSASYTWNFQGGSPASSTATNPVVAFANPGTYTFTLAGTNGTSTTSITKTITVVTTPIVSALSGIYCEGNSYTLTAGGATSYTWLSASGPVSNSSNFIITPMASTFYTLEGSNGACTARGIYTINTVPSPTFSISDQTICPGGTATLSANGAGSYTWNTGAATSSIVSSPNATTLYTVTSIGTGCSTTKTVSVIVSAVPLSLVSTSNSSCYNSCNGRVNASTSGGQSPYTYSISGANCTALPCSSLCTGIYTLETSSALLCRSTTTFAITEPTAVQATISMSNSACSTCSSGILSVAASGGTGQYTYSWTPSGGTLATASDLAPGCYTVTLTDANGCAIEKNSCVSFFTGIQNVNLKKGLSIYPNPAQTTATIALEQASFNYTLYNNLGQVIQKKNDNEEKAVIDLSSFAKGIYLIELESGKEIIRTKLVVE